MRPAVIGITTYARNEANHYYLPAEYVDAVTRAGGIPYLIAPTQQIIPSAYLEKLDGLILAGGGDIDPKHYGGKMHKTLYMLDEERDNSEIALAKLAIKQQLPILAICRGMQIVNLVEGGNLHPHLPDVVGEKVLHRAPPREAILHTITINANSKFSKLVDKLEFEAISWHHQAINSLAPSLQAIGFSADNVIEAIEMPGHIWLFGIQWHPELTAATDPTQQGLFNAFIHAAITHRKGDEDATPK